MAAPNSTKPPATGAPHADTAPSDMSLSGSGLYGGEADGGVQGMLCADARGLCVQGLLRCGAMRVLRGWGWKEGGRWRPASVSASASASFHIYLFTLLYPTSLFSTHCTPRSQGRGRPQRRRALHCLNSAGRGAGGGGGRGRGGQCGGGAGPADGVDRDGAAVR